jgi:hypothetical protein
MKRIFMISAMLVLAPFVSALGLPAPMTAEELTENSDIIVEAQVIDVECMGWSEVPEQSVTRNYRATLEVLNVVKGEPGDSVLLDFSAVEYAPNYSPPSCSGGASHPLGEIGTYHLQGPNDEGVYSPPSWNAFNEADDSDPGELEACEEAGDTAGTDGPDPVKSVSATSNTESGFSCTTGHGSHTGALFLLLFVLAAIWTRRSKVESS